MQSRDILGAIPISGYVVQKATDLKWPKKHAIKLMHSVRTYYLAADSESGAAKYALLVRILFINNMTSNARF